MIESLLQGSGVPYILPNPESGKKYLLDLPSVIAAQLSDAGLLHSEINSSGYCTFSEKERFYSYRRSGDKGRMLAIAYSKQ